MINGLKSSKNVQQVCKKFSFHEQNLFNFLFSESIWGDKEAIFFKKFVELQNEEIIKMSKLEDIIDEIKLCVSEHLSDIAIKEADLFKQLILIKDFYLLGKQI